MAKNKKNKNKKKMSPEQKENIKALTYRHLWSNDVCVESARHNPWWIALIFFLLSVMIPVIPSIVANMNAYGSSIFAAQTYGFDTQVTRFALDVESKGIELTVEDDIRGKILTDKDSKWKATYGEDDKIQYYHVNQSTQEYDLLAYYTDKTGESLKVFNSTISSYAYQKGTTNQINDKEIINATPTDYYRPNTIIFNPDTFGILLIKPGTINPVSESRVGDYKCFDDGYVITDFVRKALNGKTFTSSDIETLIADQTFVDSAFNNFKEMLDLSFLTTKHNAVWLQCLISLSVYIILGFFMGLMIFILTRGKKNYFNILTFLDCQKINAMSMFSPGLLGMILGFIFPQYSIMFFIVFLGLRTMWMSMRQLRPTY